jgi:hypothetical protein
MLIEREVTARIVIEKRMGAGRLPSGPSHCSDLAKRLDSFVIIIKDFKQIQDPDQF